jgi:hypothetical protein
MAAGGGFFHCLEVLHKGTVKNVESLHIDNGASYLLRLNRKETPKKKGGTRRESVQASKFYGSSSHREVEKGRNEDTRDSGEAEG